MAETDLIVDFIGEVHRVAEGDVLTFGRAADLVVDDANPYLHRVVGRFFFHADAWWLENLGSHVAVDLATTDGALEAADADLGEPSAQVIQPSRHG